MSFKIINTWGTINFYASKSLKLKGLRVGEKMTPPYLSNWNCYLLTTCSVNLPSYTTLDSWAFYLHFTPSLNLVWVLPEAQKGKYELKQNPFSSSDLLCIYKVPSPNNSKRFLNIISQGYIVSPSALILPKTQYLPQKSIPYHWPSLSSATISLLRDYQLMLPTTSGELTAQC